MARTYPAKRARIATETDTEIDLTWALGPFPRCCPVCQARIKVGQRITADRFRRPVHARCADAGEPLP
jgi:hypothetical protein